MQLRSLLALLGATTVALAQVPDNFVRLIPPCAREPAIRVLQSGPCPAWDRKCCCSDTNIWIQLTTGARSWCRSPDEIRLFFSFTSAYCPERPPPRPITTTRRPNTTITITRPRITTLHRTINGTVTRIVTSLRPATTTRLVQPPPVTIRPPQPPPVVIPPPPPVTVRPPQPPPVVIPPPPPVTIRPPPPPPVVPPPPPPVVLPPPPRVTIVPPAPPPVVVNPPPPPVVVKPPPPPVVVPAPATRTVVGGPTSVLTIPYSTGAAAPMCMNLGWKAGSAFAMAAMAYAIGEL